METLKGVFDPEIPLSIVDLGLIYDIIINNGKVDIKMTLTTIGCPAAGDIEHEVKQLVEALGGVDEVKVEITFEPPWNPSRMTQAARDQLGI